MADLAAAEAVARLFQRFEKKEPVLQHAGWEPVELDGPTLWHTVTEFAAADAAVLERAMCRLYAELSSLTPLQIYVADIDPKKLSYAVALDEVANARRHQGPGGQYAAGVQTAISTACDIAISLNRKGRVNVFAGKIFQSIQEMPLAALQGFIDHLSFDVLENAQGADPPLGQALAGALRVAAECAAGTPGAEIAASALNKLPLAPLQAGSSSLVTPEAIALGSSVSATERRENPDGVVTALHTEKTTGIVTAISLNDEIGNTGRGWLTYHVRFPGSPVSHEYDSASISAAPDFPSLRLDRGLVTCPLVAEHILIQLQAAHWAGIDGGLVPLRESDYNDHARIQLALSAWSGIPVSTLADRIAARVQTAAQHMRGLLTTAPDLYTLHRRYMPAPSTANGHHAHPLNGARVAAMDFHTRRPEGRPTPFPRHLNRPPGPPPPNFGRGSGGPHRAP